MKALERIEEIEEMVNNWNGCPTCGDNSVVLLKAFNAILATALKMHKDERGDGHDECVYEEFEEWQKRSCLKCGKVQMEQI